ncbi:NACHT domain-containing protein [Duganella sp. S19_KUP01_CR8]|uniref:NACHT domain-containing protein n=1 Tax=Duganella sp. S19_KUP01_CR8 TaxID=3025502 RepID=UPI002FCDBA40
MLNTENPLISPIFYWTAFLLLVITFVTAIWAFVYWWKKNKYTREKFAFLGGVALFSMISLFLAQLYQGLSLIAIVVNVILALVKFLGWEDVLGLNGVSYSSGKLSNFETIACLVSIFFMGNWYIKIFTNWDGQKSKSQNEQERYNTAPSIFYDVSLLLSLDKKKREKLEPQNEAVERHVSLLELVEDNRAWHEFAKHLILLNRRQYAFDDSYDHLHKCWWGIDSNINALICLVCVDDFDDNNSSALVLYAKKVMLARGVSGVFEIVVAYKGEEKEYKSAEGHDYSITFVSEQKLLDDLVDFSYYFADIKKRVMLDFLPDSTVSIGNVYSPSNFRLTKDSEGDDGDLESFIRDWLSENSVRQLSLLGEYGQGKSTISLMLSYKLINEIHKHGSGRIPILVELRGKSPRSLSPEELLATWAFRYRIDVQGLLQLLIAGRILLIFEGFDEIDLTGDTDIRLNHFRTLWQLSYPNSKILITGRPNFFLDESERKRALGIETAHPTRPYCQAVFLAPFNIQQIENSLRSVDEITRNEIISLALRDQKFKEIISRPSLLFIVSTLWKREKLSEKSERISSAFVMELFIRHSYRRQGAKQTEKNFMALNSAERAYFMTGIAVFMGTVGHSNQISSAQLDLAIEALATSMPDDVSLSAGAMANEIRLPLTKSHPDRFDWENSSAEIFEHIKTDVRACGILVTDLSKDGTFKFAHKSFMEFLQAEVISNMFSSETSERLIAVSLIKSWDGKSLITNNSPETMFFLVELLRDKVKSSYSKSSDELVSRILFDIVVLDSFSDDSVTRMKRVILGMGLVLFGLVPKFKGVRALSMSISVFEPFVQINFWGMLLSILFATFLAKLTTKTEVSLMGVTLSIFVSFLGGVLAMFIYFKAKPKSAFAMFNRKSKVSALEHWFDLCNKSGIDISILRNVLGGKLTKLFELRGRTSSNK